MWELLLQSHSLPASTDLMLYLFFHSLKLAGMSEDTTFFSTDYGVVGPYWVGKHFQPRNEIG